MTILPNIISSSGFTSGDTVVSSLCELRKRPLLSSIPAFSVLQDRIQNVVTLFLPKTWSRIMEFEEMKVGSFSSFNKSILIQSFIGFISPLVILWFIDFITFMIFNNNNRRSMTTATTTMTTMTAMMRLLLLRRRRAASLFIPPSLVVFSPWCLGCLHRLFQQALIVIRAVHSILKKRSPTLSRAKTTIDSRIQHHRAYRTRRYDVYLPSSLFSTTSTTTSTSTLATTNKLRVLLFLPGAYVSHEAYSEIASRLSDEGFVVAVLSMEPLRLADSRLGNTDVTTIKEIMNSITNEIVPSTSKLKLKSKPLANMGNADNNISNNNNKKIIEFTLMGHSLGAFAAMKLFRELVVDKAVTNDTNNKNEDKAKHNQQQQQPQQKESSMAVIAIKKSLSMPPEIEIGISNKLIMWGVAAFIPYLTDLSSKSIHQTTNAKNKNVIDILIVQGTSDTVIKMMNTTTTKKEEFDSYFPPQVLHKVLSSNSSCASSTTRTEMITGGTHEGFSSYRSSFSDNNKEDKDDNANNVDDDDTLSLSKQHEQVCYITAQFLRS
jgi:positive regulator of sigma E activity